MYDEWHLKLFTTKNTYFSASIIFVTCITCKIIVLFTHMAWFLREIKIIRTIFCIKFWNCYSFVLVSFLKFKRVETPFIVRCPVICSPDLTWPIKETVEYIALAYYFHKTYCISNILFTKYTLSTIITTVNIQQAIHKAVNSLRGHFGVCLILTRTK